MSNGPLQTTRDAIRERASSTDTHAGFASCARRRLRVTRANAAHDDLTELPGHCTTVLRKHRVTPVRVR